MAASTVDLSPFHYDEDNRVFVCITCQRCVSGEVNAMKAHLSKCHSSSIHGEKKVAILAAVSDASNPLKREDVARIKVIAAAGKALPKLPIIKGFACEGNEGCQMVMETKEELEKHQRQQHSGEGWVEEAYIQALFWRTASGVARFFRVRHFPPGWDDAGAEEQVGRGDDDLEQIVELMREYELKCERERAVWTADVDRRELSLWDRRAGWHRQLIGIDLVAHNALTSLPNTKVDPESWRVVLLPAIKAVMQRCHSGAARKSVYVRRLFKSADNNPAVIEYEPLYIVEGSSLKKYTVTWQHLVCFLLRTVEMRERASRIQWRGEVKPKVKQIITLLQTGGSADTVSKAVREALVALVKARVGADAGLSPLMSFIGAWAFRPDSKVWRTANEVSPMLSQLVYGLRIIGMEDALPQDEEDDSVDVNEVAREFVNDYLRDGVQTVFTELFSLKLYAKKRAAEFYVRPTINWNSDASILYHQGIPLKVEDLRVWMRELVTETTNIMCDKLVLQDFEWLKRHRDPGPLLDQMTWSNAGESFRHFPPNGLRDRWKNLLERMRTHPQGQGVWNGLRSLAGVAGVRRDNLALAAFLETVKGALERLCVLMMMMTAPPRAMELTAWKHANGQSTMRNFYLVAGELVTISDYGKTDAVLGAPKLVVRYVPREIARLYISYVVDVWPMAQLIEAAIAKSDGIESIMSPFLFECDGETWDTDKVTRLMAKYSTKSLGFTLGTAKWREIAIAIDKKLIRSGDGPPSVGALHALQAGHSAEIEKHHYALTVGMLQGVNDDTLTAFAFISKRWERWWKGVTTANVASVPEDVKDEVPAMMKLVLQKLNKLSEAVVKLDERFDDKKAGMPTPTASPTQTLSIYKPTTLVDVEPDGNGQMMPALKQKVVPDHQKRRWTSDEEWETLNKKKRSTTADDKVDDLIRELMGVKAQVRSPGQREAIRAVAVEKATAAFIRLPPAAGKSLVMQATAATARTKVTVVVVPFLALRDDLRQRCTDLDRPIQTSVWKETERAQTTMVFVTPERAVQGAFRKWLVEMDSSQRLEAIFVDECHVLSLDPDWRPAMDGVFYLLGVMKMARIVLMSGTLPDAMVEDIKNQVGEKGERSWHLVSAAVDPRLMELEVHMLPRQKQLDLLRALMVASTTTKRLLIVVMGLIDGHQLSTALGVPFYHGGLSDEDRARIWQTWKDGEKCLVGTSAVAVGTDAKDVALVVHYRGAYGLASYYQHAMRGGRNGMGAKSICLVSPEDEELLLKRIVREQKGWQRGQEESIQQYDARMLWEYVWGSGCRYRLLYRYLNGVETSQGCPWLHNCLSCQSSAESAVAQMHVSVSRSGSAETRRERMGAGSNETGTTIEGSSRSSDTASKIPQQPLTHVSDSMTTTESDAIQSVGESGPKSQTISVGGFAFPVECKGKSRRAVLATLRELERYDPKQLLQKALDMVKRFKRGGCLACWLEGNAAATDHGLVGCPIFEIQAEDLNAINSGWSIGSPRNLTKGMHWCCGLPVTVHDGTLSGKPCSQWGNLGRDIVAAAFCVGYCEGVFESAGVVWPGDGWRSLERYEVIQHWRQLGREGAAANPKPDWLIEWSGLVVKIVFMGSLARRD